jgi:hypothetical protein
MGQTGNPRRVGLVFPILLITIGGLFLYENSHPYFNPWSVLWKYWPLILIFVGLGKIWDNMRRSKDPNAPPDFPIGSTLGMLLFVLILVTVLWRGHAFSKNRDYNPRMMHVSKTVDLQGAQTVSATVNLGAGELTINKTDSPYLLDASFEYFDNWRTPNIEYNVDGTRGDLTVSESHSDNFRIIAPNDTTRWNLGFGKMVPMNLDVNMGAGEGNLRLRNLPITNLTVNMGAGRAEVDLTGERSKDLDAEIHGGVGEAVIHLPKTVGVVVQAEGRIGTVDTTGLKKEDGQYVNEAYGKTKPTIHLDVKGGIGRIHLIEE